MNRQVGWPRKQKNNQNDTFPNSLSWSLSTLDSFFSMIITGACKSMAINA